LTLILTKNSRYNILATASVEEKVYKIGKHGGSALLRQPAILLPFVKIHIVKIIF